MRIILVPSLKQHTWITLTSNSVPTIILFIREIRGSGALHSVPMAFYHTRLSSMTVFFHNAGSWGSIRGHQYTLWGSAYTFLIEQMTWWHTHKRNSALWAQIWAKSIICLSNYEQTYTIFLWISETRWKMNKDRMYVQDSKHMKNRGSARSRTTRRVWKSHNCRGIFLVW